MNRRRFLTLAGALASGGLAGCSTLSPWSSPSTRPRADHDVRLSNHSDSTAALDVRVVRVATDETVFEDRFEIDPDDETVVYNTQRADPDGVEAFEVIASDGATTGRATIETSDCFGDALVIVGSDGELSVTYAIC